MSRFFFLYFVISYYRKGIGTMTINQKPSGIAKSIPKGIATGTLCSMIIVILLSMIFAKLIATGRMAESKLGYGIMIILFLASFAGSLISISYTKRRILYVAIIFCVTFIILLSLLTTLLFGGRLEGILPSSMIVFAGGIMPALLRSSSNKKAKHPRRKKQNR